MMSKRFVLLIAAAITAFFAMPCAAMAAENNSVSGYVSLTEGVKIFGDDTETVIQYDKSCDKSVLRAVNDLAEDLKAVTGEAPYIQSDDSATHRIGMPVGISISENKMEVTLASPFEDPEDSYVCYIAAYEADGRLAAVVESDGGEHAGGMSEGGILTYPFSKVLQKPAGGKMKAFLWNRNTLEPYGEPFGMYKAESCIIVGTIGDEGMIDELAAANKIDISDINNKKEAFTVQEADGKIVIAGSDKRGTIYGIYDLSEKIGVSPWKFWADVEPEMAEELYINLPDVGYTEGEPSVEYRGIFLNDEFNLNQWTNNDFSANMNNAKYAKVFEVMLRLKLNTLWPAMHKYSTAFHAIDGAAALADEYGIIMGSSHAEPLLRNNLGELYAFQVKWEAEMKEKGEEKTLYKYLKDESGKPVAYYWTDHDNNNNPVDNKEFLEAYWRESVKNNGSYDNIYTLGMRGVHDGDFTTNMDKTTAMNEIIAVQRKIIKEEICDKQGIAIEDVPQVFIPYKDVQDLYNTGNLNIPDDVTIMWTDDNYGYVRQNANDTERARSGGAGLYHHISYYGNPTSYLWLTSTQPGLLREELTKAYETGADKVWILNVGDLKPAEKEIEYYAKLAKNVEAVNNEEIADLYAQSAKRDFNLSDEDAEEYAAIMDEYYELANAKRPEFYRTNDAQTGFAMALNVYGDEGQKYVDRYKAITQKAEDIYNKLDESKKPSFFELVFYPVRSAGNMAEDFVQASRADWYNEQGRGAVANRYADEANAAAQQIKDDTSEYTTMLDGKWNKMMVINPSHFTSCDARITLDLNPSKVKSLDFTKMGISAEGQTDLSETPSITLSNYDTAPKYIDIFNTGYGSFDYEISAYPSTIKVNKTSGTVYDSDRVYIALDTSASGSGHEGGYITVTEKIDGHIVETLSVQVDIAYISQVTSEKTYVEADGTVSIEAEHITSSVKKDDFEWKVEKDMGRSGDSLKLYPNLVPDSAFSAENVTENSAYAEYDIYFADSGEYNLTVYRMPTLNERGKMRFGIGIDNDTAVVLGGNSSYAKVNAGDRSNAWGKGVVANTQVMTGNITVPSEGKHTIRLYGISPWVVIDKIVLTKNTAPSSYFGAPESYNTTYNNSPIELPEPSVTKAITDSITKTYEPDAIIGSARNDGEKLTVPVYALNENVANAIVVVTTYDDSGNMVHGDFNKITFTEGEAAAQFTPANLPDGEYSTQITVIDNFTDMNVIAPYKNYDNDIVTEAKSSAMKLKADLNKYIGKKSAILIANTEITENIAAGNIKYFYGGDVTRDAYKSIPFANAAAAKYYLRASVQGRDTINETRSTAVNIYPVNNGLPVYEYQQDFEGFTDNAGTWSGTSATLETNNTKYAMITASSGTVGGYTSFDNAIDTAGRSVYISADVKLTAPSQPSSGSKGNSQFTIGNTYSASNFSGSTVSWGIKDESSGHILAIEYNGGSTLKLNKTTLTSAERDAIIGGWVTLQAEADFVDKKLKNLTIKPVGGGDAIVSIDEIDFFSASVADNIGSVYMRAATLNGTTSVDNIKVYTLSSPQYAIDIKPADDDTSAAVSDAVITVTNSAGSKITPEADGTYAGKYLMPEGDYTVTVTADGYRKTNYILELTPSLESTEVEIPMTSTASLTPATVTLKYVDEENNPIKEEVLNDDLYAGDAFTVPEEMKANFTVKADGQYKRCVFNSVSPSEEITLDASNEIKLIYNYTVHDYYEDFEDYTVEDNTWKLGSESPAASIESTDDGNVLSYKSAGATVGAYTTFDEVNTAGKRVRIEADVKFTKPTGSGVGNSQFSIGNTEPSFDGSNINYGIITTSTQTHAPGHIIGLEYNAGAGEFLVNGEAAPSSFIGDWMHISADADFNAKTVKVTLTNDDGQSAVFDTDFYSGENVSGNIGSMYMRAAKPDGAVIADNINIVITGDAEPSEESVLNGKTVYAFGDSIVYGHNSASTSFMQLTANRYGMTLNQMARNGATVIKSTSVNDPNDIITQINAAPAAAPDFIVFDGYTNDAYGESGVDTYNDNNYPDVTKVLGEAQGSDATTFDNTTFCGAFEEILYTMKNKWPDAKIVFVTIHKSGARDMTIQTKLHDLTVNMCKEWGITVVDMFTDTDLDTTDPEQMAAYMIGKKGSHPNVDCSNKYYIPMVRDTLIKLCTD